MLENTEIDGIYKDAKSGVLINTNVDKLSAYKKQKRIMNEYKNAVNLIKRMQMQINILEKEVEILKEKV